MEPSPNGGGGGVAFHLIATEQTFRVNADATTLPIVLITAASVLYGVTFSWFVKESVFKANGAPALAEEKTALVNAVCAHAHVEAFRSEQEQDRSGLLFNSAVITVGTEDLRITDEVRVPMSSIGYASTFAMIDAAWALLVNLGAGVEPPLA
jgi:hypothetical protein